MNYKSLLYDPDNSAETGCYGNLEDFAGDLGLTIGLPLVAKVTGRFCIRTLYRGFGVEILAQGNGEHLEWPLHTGSFDVHVEEHTIRFADESRSSIIPYFELWGFRITEAVKEMEVFEGTSEWLPMSSYTSIELKQSEPTKKSRFISTRVLPFQLQPPSEWTVPCH
ncbi:MAG: hypothetical protein QNJ97_08430 [Myxococcota bacterium]|nr:hypothetical protein [Myxococcota bacterium]